MSQLEKTETEYVSLTQIRPECRTRTGWEKLVMMQSNDYAVINLNRVHERGLTLEPLRFPRRARGEEYGIAEDIYNLERRLEKETPDHLVKRRTPFYIDLARRIRTKGKFDLIPKLQLLIISNSEDSGEVVNNILVSGNMTLYLLACSADRFLVGAKDGLHWKNVDIPVALTPDGPAVIPLFHSALSYLNNVWFVGRRELKAVPSKMIHPDAIDQLDLAPPARPMEDFLERAYYDRKYVVPAEGAEIVYRRAGDLRGMNLILSGDQLTARVITSQGEVFVRINMDNGTWGCSQSTFDQLWGLKNPQRSVWTDLVAEAYHDLVTEEHISTTLERQLKTPRLAVLDKPLQVIGRPYVIYIPRQVREGEPNEPRFPYQDPNRPFRPRHVGGFEGFPHKGKITAKQRNNIRELEDELRKVGMEVMILENLPPGFTWVRPYNSPSGTAIEKSRTPTFIKRRMVERIAQRLKDIEAK